MSDIINGNMSEEYFRSIVKSISYVYDDLFSKDDIEMITKNTFFSEDDEEVEELTTVGLKKNDVRNLQTTIWQKWNDEIFHSFENIYGKLICCLGNKNGDGKKSMPLTLLIFNPETGKMETDSRTYTVTSDTCEFSGVNFYDDNTSSGGYNSNCESLMNKYCLFLQKYDPKNELIEQLCGCVLAKKFISPELLNPNNAMALNQILGQRNCGISQCINKNAYRRQGDRGACVSTINICTNNLNVSEINATTTEFNNISMNNDCGGNKEIIPVNEVVIPIPIIEPVEEIDVIKPLELDELAVEQIIIPLGTDPDQIDPDQTTQNVSFIEGIINWFMSLFSQTEGFSSINNNFNKIYSVFSIIVIYILVLKDPLNIQKKINKMF